MPASVISDRAEMRDAVFFDGPDAGRKHSRFWLLLVLASVIASAGVMADSEATVIGAMIVAPLRTPILGTMLAIVLADRRNLVRSVSMLVGGAAVAVGVGVAMGAMAIDDTAVAASSQMLEWSTPGLVDLVAALAVGVVGSVALVRRDISDTLPGVAIAISLVPPLTVAGLALSQGDLTHVAGALLLFATNVAAILVVGVVTMAIYRVHRIDGDRADATSVDQRHAYLVIGLSLAAIGATLGWLSWSTAATERHARTVGDIVERWAEPEDWDVVDVTTDGDDVVVRLEGPLPTPDVDVLSTTLRRAGIDVDDIELQFTPLYIVQLGD